MAESRRIIVKCGDCGVNRVPLDAVVVRYCLDDDQWTYRFRCPACDRLTASRSSARAGFNAMLGGAAVETWRLPAELAERPDGPPLTLTDLLDLHLTLEDPDWVNALKPALG